MFCAATAARRILTIALLTAATCTVSTAQIEDSRDDYPPPLKTISKTEKKALEAEKDSRKRTILSIDMLEARLKNAESASMRSGYRQMFFELGVFQGLIENTLQYLFDSNRGTDKDFDNFKKFEMALRAYTPRVEVLRRESPDRYERYLQSVLKQIRDARSKAVEPLFGDKVIQEERRNDEDE